MELRFNIHTKKNDFLLYIDGQEKHVSYDPTRKTYYVYADVKNTDENWITGIALGEAIESLGDREKHILSLRFYEGKTQMEVAREIGISQAQVSRLEKSAIDTIKSN